MSQSCDGVRFRIELPPFLDRFELRDGGVEHFCDQAATYITLDTETGDLQLEDTTEFVAYSDRSHEEIESPMLMMLFEEGTENRVR